MSDKEQSPAPASPEQPVASEVEATMEDHENGSPAKQESGQTNGDDAPTADDTEYKAAAANDTVTAEESGADATAPDRETTSSTKKNQKRRSSAGVPEHKNKKLNRKKSVATLHLDAKPGDYYWARLKGFPPWPAIISDEDMLPEILLATRPVTAKRPDGSYRTDYQDDGKNVRDRTYPVMYLHTNEFSWLPNTDLTPLDTEDIKNADKSKKSKQLLGAYQVAGEGHDLSYYKQLLRDHEKALAEDIEENERRAQEKQEKKEKKAKRQSKSKGTVEEGEEDAEMEDAPEDVATDGEAVKTKKVSKKRKKDVESEGEAAKPVKTPKTKKAAAPKTPNGDSAAKPKAKKGKAIKAETETPAAKPLTEEEKKQKKEKEVLFLRHKLQKGFLSRDQAPKEEEMKPMAEHFRSLEGLKDLDVETIRTTKIHKVLKAIIKLNSIPKDEEYKFKERSIEMLDIWQKAIASSDGATAAGEDAATNGAKDDKSDADKAGDDEAPAAAAASKDTEVADVKEPSEAPADDVNDDADAAMVDEKSEAAEVAEEDGDEESVEADEKSATAEEES